MGGVIYNRMELNGIVEYPNGDKAWYQNGKLVTQDEVEWSAIEELFVL